MGPNLTRWLQAVAREHLCTTSDVSGALCLSSKVILKTDMLSKDSLGRIGPKLAGMAFRDIDSKAQQAVKCLYEASSIRNLAVQDTKGSFVYSKLIMMPPRHIERDGYHALYWRDDSDLTDLWGEFPEIVVGHYLVNTSYDSGFLKLSDSECQIGWHMVGRLAHSPQISRVDQIPHDQFDEWLIFESPVQIEEVNTMVNHYGFNPINYGWEEKREKFWEQVVRLRPLHVLGENDGLYLVTRDNELVRKIGRIGPKLP